MKRRAFVIAGALCLTSVAAQASTFESILTYSRRFGLNQPNGGLTFDSSGAVYGAAYYGGARKTPHEGAIFKLTPPAQGQTEWTPTTLYNFTYSIAAGPTGVQFLDDSGLLYGTANNGGAAGRGSVFTLAPPGQGQIAWTYSALYEFTAGDGYGPNGVVRDAKFNLYGTNPFGDTDNNGRIFELSPPPPGQTAWTHTTLHVFSRSEGRSPSPPVLDPSAGVLYGLLGDLGTGAAGAVFALSPPSNGHKAWKLKILHSFAGQEGRTPQGNLLLDATGALYGANTTGGKHGFGTVFRLAPPAGGQTDWQIQILHDFAGKDGIGPLSLAGDPAVALYGTTYEGGPGFRHRQGNGNGTMFSLTPQGGGSWAFTQQHALNHREGTEPDPIVQAPTGDLFGMTQPGSGPANFGTVFRLTP